MSVAKSVELRFDRRKRTLIHCAMGKGMFMSMPNMEPAPTVGMPSSKRRRKRPKSVGGGLGIKEEGLEVRLLDLRRRLYRGLSSQESSVRPQTAERMTSRKVSQG